MNKKINEILQYMNKLYPNAHCELNYNKDYELLMAIVLSAQTTDKKVNKVTKVLFEKYPTLDAISQAPLDDIENIIREIGTFKKKSVFLKNIANSLLKDQNGIVPNDRTYLNKLNGVGRKTINVFQAEYYNIPALAVDTHVERVSKRLSLAQKNDTVIDVEKKLKRKIPKSMWIKAHHQFIFFGRYHCKAINPNCKNCQLKHICKYFKDKIMDAEVKNK